MNKVILCGRLSCDPQRKRASNTDYVQFYLAVSRNTSDGSTDFIPIVAFGKDMDIIMNYCKKGKQVLIEGRIQQYRSNNDGTLNDRFNVVVIRFEFVGSPDANGKRIDPTNAEPTAKKTPSFKEVTADKLPF